jgi:hypothetical protein
MVKNEQILEMVNRTNPELAQQLGNIIGGNIVKQIHCDSKKCKGAVIANIYHDGQVIEVKNSEISGALSTRKRFDGYIGVLCRCGNDSRIAPQEKGIMSGNMPSREDLQKIYDRIHKNPSEYQSKNGSVAVDGFTIEDLRS